MTLSSKVEMLCGLHAVIEVIRADRRRVHEIWVTRDRASEIRRVIGTRDIPVREVLSGEIARLVGPEHHQGVAARVDCFQYGSFDAMLQAALRDPLGAFIVILDQIQDPQNLGAILRTAHCCGVHGVILPKDNAASVNPTVCRTAAGATEYLSIVQVVNIAQTIKSLKTNNVWIVGAEGETAQSLYEYRFDGHHAIVLGAEGKGVRRLVREGCDALVAIPMQGKIDSYNVSVAGGMILGEVMRQRILKKTV